MSDIHPQDGGDYSYEDDPPDLPEEGVKKTATNSSQIIIPTLTELTFLMDIKPNPSTIEAKVKTLLTALLKGTPEFHLTQELIWPFHKDSNLKPISAMKITQCSAIQQYFHFTASTKSIHGKLRIGFPTHTDLGKLKQIGSPLRGNLIQLKCSWNTTTLESLDVTTPVFLYGIPTRGTDLKELTQDFASACEIDLNEDNIFLQASQLTRSKKTAWVIFLKCATASAQRIVDSIAANLPLAQENLAPHILTSRVKAMVLLSKYHNELEPDDILFAIEEQSNLLNELHEVTFTDCDSVDKPFILNRRQVTLRTIIHDFKRGTLSIVHNIRQETTTTISITILKEHQAILMAKFQSIMEHLQSKGMLLSLTGHLEIPQLKAKTITGAYYNKSARKSQQIIGEKNSSNNTSYNSKKYNVSAESGSATTRLSDMLSENLFMGDEDQKPPQTTFLPHTSTWAINNNFSQAANENQLLTSIEERTYEHQEKLQELELSINSNSNQFKGVLDDLQQKLLELQDIIITNREELLEQQQHLAERLDSHRHYTVTGIEELNNGATMAEAQINSIRAELANQTQQVHNSIADFYKEARLFQQAIYNGVTNQVEGILRTWSLLNTPTKQRTKSSILKRPKQDVAQPRVLNFTFIPPEGSNEGENQTAAQPQALNLTFILPEGSNDGENQTRTNSPPRRTETPHIDPMDLQRDDGEDPNESRSEGAQRNI